MKPHIHCEMIKAWADGATIQFFYGKQWLDAVNPSWHKDHKYRIKPEPKQDVIYWTRVNKWKDAFTGLTTSAGAYPNIAFTFDSETGDLKAVEILK